jgi:hypothetical protein
MDVAIFSEFRFANAVMRLRGIIGESSQLPVKLERADVGTVLIAQAMRSKYLVHDGYRKFADLAGGLAHHKVVFADECLRFETNVLNVNVLCHKTSCRMTDLSGATESTSFALCLSYRCTKMERVPEALQFPVIIERSGTFSVKPHPL